MKFFGLFLVLLHIQKFKAAESAEDEEPDDLPLCKTEIISAYNIASYTSPKQVKLHLFPNIDLSCCSIYDQYFMYMDWKKNIKVRLKRYNFEYSKKLRDLYRIMRKIVKVNMNGLVSNL